MCDRVSSVEPDFDAETNSVRCQVELRLERADRPRMSRVEHVERLRPERLLEHLGRERRAAHPEQHDRVDLADQRVGELEQQVDVLAHPPGLVEPAEPLRLRPRPVQTRRVARPDPLDDLGSRSRGARALRLAPMLSTISSNESMNFCTPSASSVAVTSS